MLSTKNSPKRDRTFSDRIKRKGEPLYTPVSIEPQFLHVRVTRSITGCRPSKLIEITPARVDLSGGTVTLRSLKKRKDAQDRLQGLPVPPDYLVILNTAYDDIRKARGTPKRFKAPIWLLSRVRVWQIVKGVMIEAGIPDAPHRSPKGLRHGFGINATVKGVPLHMLSKWMGPCPAQHDSDLHRRHR